MSFVREALHNISDQVKSGLGAVEDVIQAQIHSHTHLNAACHRLHRHEQDNRFLSFAPPRTGNEAKWFVDGCGYMWAVSVAIEEAKESIVSSLGEELLFERVSEHDSCAPDSISSEHITDYHYPVDLRLVVKSGIILAPSTK